MNKDPGTGSASCFLHVDNGVDGPSECTMPVKWHGSIRSAGGTSHRVFSCNAHAGTIDDRIPVVRRRDVTEAPSHRIKMLQHGRHPSQG